MKGTVPFSIRLQCRWEIPSLKGTVPSGRAAYFPASSGSLSEAWPKKYFQPAGVLT
jgi:hypothetical protein